MPRIDPAPTYTMRQLAAFVAVAETGTISGAAERLHLSPSALSASLTELERALKVQLCVRRRSFGIQLTRTGESVLVRARALLQQAGELESDALGTGGSVSGPIAIGCYPALGPTVLPSMIAGFTRENPDAQVEFREDTQNRLQTHLENGELDLAIAYDLDLSPQLRTVPLAIREPLIVLGAEHPPRGPSDRSIFRTSRNTRWFSSTRRRAPNTRSTSAAQADSSRRLHTEPRTSRRRGHLSGADSAGRCYSSAPRWTSRTRGSR